MTDLKDWTITFIKNRDLTFRKLKNVTEKKDVVEFEFKDKTVGYVINDTLSDSLLEKLKSYDHKAFSCLNSEENFKYLIKNWEKFSKIKNFSILFVNMKTQDKWTISPYTHSLIADAESIESGLRTMFDTANGKIAEIKQGKKKSSMFEEGSSAEDDEGDGE